MRKEETLPSLGATLFTVLLPIGLMLVKTIAELNMTKGGTLYMLLEFIGNPITAMFIAVFVAYYVLGIRQNMGMSTLLTHTENCFGSIANILLIIGAGGAFNAILKTSGLAGGADSACRSRFRHRGNDGRNRHRRTDASALSRREPGNHRYRHRLRRDWLHYRDGLPVLAG